MFLKREVETDDVAMKKYLVVKEKYFICRNFNISRNAKFLRDHKNILKMSLHILAFQHILNIFNLFPIKTYIFLEDKGPSPLNGHVC